VPGGGGSTSPRGLVEKVSGSSLAIRATLRRKPSEFIWGLELLIEIETRTIRTPFQIKLREGVGPVRYIYIYIFLSPNDRFSERFTFNMSCALGKVEEKTFLG